MLIADLDHLEKLNQMTDSLQIVGSASLISLVINDGGLSLKLNDEPLFSTTIGDALADVSVSLDDTSNLTTSFTGLGLSQSLVFSRASSDDGILSVMSSSLGIG